MTGIGGVSMRANTMSGLSQVSSPMPPFSAAATHTQPINKKALANNLQVPVFIGVPETIRTSDPFLRREVLYPSELRGQVEKDGYV